ncbi:MAG: adenylate/guanylate cyclase domain-containing protein [Candidatus Aureabacteria bacterium]|nr:adenylate/guanylate cyclase domain-containing protein [Candidatus Auribacterota bacterium]
MNVKKCLIICFFIPLVSCVFAYFFCMLEPIKELENRIYDYKLRVNAGKKVSDRIRLVVVDDQSIRMGDSKWPWPWTNHAQVLQFLSRTNPSAVGFDIRFEYYEKKKYGLDNIIYFTRLLNNRVIWPYYFKIKKDNGVSLYRDYVDEGADLLSDDLAVDVRHETLGGIIKSEAVQLPVSEIAGSGFLGFVNAPEDSDGVVRKLPMLISYSGKVYPSFMLAVLLRHFNRSPGDIELAGNTISIRGTSVRIPVDDNYRMLVNFRGSARDFKGDPAIQIIKADSQLSENMLPVVSLGDYSEKIVIYGAGITGGDDLGLIPISSNKVPLLLVHANALNTVLEQDFIVKASFLCGISIAFLFSVIIGAVNIPYRFWVYVPLTVLAACFFIVFSFYLFGNFNIYINTVIPYTAMSICFGGAVVYKHVIETKDKRYIKKVLGRYISRNIMDMLLKDPSKLKLHGERKNITVLFSDIRGFTAYCEKRAPDEVVPVLNEYLDRMTKVIISHNGTVDKYIGDAIMAFWNAPVEQEDHARLAALTALDMMAELKLLHSDFSEKGVEAIDMGIGINTGPMMVGNMGSSQIYDYTVIGDNVNLASRVEGLTRKYPFGIIVTETTYDCIKGEFEVDFLDEVTVKGKDKKVKIFCVKGIKS